MNLEQRTQEDLKTAMKAKDEASLRTLRAIKSAILLEKTSGSGQELNDATELKLLNKLAKQRQDALDIYQKEGRDDLATKEKEELEIIQKYLPAQLTPAELEAEVQIITKELEANTMADMGKVMGVASQRLLGKADGKSISEVVKKILSH